MALLLGAACTGQITGGGGGDVSGAAGAGARTTTGGNNGLTDGPLAPLGGTASLCVQGAVPELDLKRMTGTMYRNALVDIFGTPAVNAVSAELAALPSRRAGTYSTELDPPTFPEVESYVKIASGLALQLTKDAPALAALMPCLGTLTAGVDPTKDACLAQFTATLGKRLLRRPLTPAEIQDFLGAFSIGGKQSVGEGVATLLITMLIEPRFLYFLELDGQQSSAGVVKLTPHELAARLARALWDSVPDAELLAAADAGLAPNLLDQQIDRMWQDPRARPALKRFFAEWIELDKIPTFSPDPQKLGASREAMSDELLAFTDQLLFAKDGTFADLLLDREASVSDPDLAKVYGVAPGTAGQTTLLPSSRGGLLTRAAWLATLEPTNTDAGHLIKRGVKFAHMWCQDFPPPDANAVASVKDPTNPANGAGTIRQRFQSATFPRNECKTCHVRIDALGAPFGHFGAAGQWIDVETVSGPTPATLPIDTSSTVTIDSKDVPVTSALDLSTAIAESRSGPECMARQFVQNLMGRPLRNGDGCLVQVALDALTGAPGAHPPSPLRAAIGKILTAPQFASAATP